MTGKMAQEINEEEEEEAGGGTLAEEGDGQE